MKRGDLRSVLNEPPNKMAAHWSTWQDYCTSLNIDPYLEAQSENYLFSKFLPFDYAKEHSPPADDLSGLEQWRTTYAPSAEIASLGSQNPRLDVSGRIYITESIIGI